MSSEIKLTVARRGERQSDENEVLGSRQLEQMAVAAQEYQRAKSELTALRETAPDGGEALQASLERFERARCAVKEAVRI